MVRSNKRGNLPAETRKEIGLNCLSIFLLCVLFVPSCVQAEENGRWCVKVIDGDTIVLDGEETVRLIGVDTPEMDDPREAVRRFAERAKAFTGESALGKIVRLEYDWEPMDEYGRTLAYVFLPDGRLLNAEILRLGYGFAYTRKVYGRTEEFRRLEREAREAGAGLWSVSAAFDGPEVPVISWEEAADHIGETCVVRGVVVGTRNTGRVCYLNFHKDWSRHFTAVIFARDFSKFPPHPERFYLNREIEVRGLIKKYRDKPEIICTSSDQISVIR